MTPNAIGTNFIADKLQHMPYTTMTDVELIKALRKALRAEGYDLSLTLSANFVKALRLVYQHGEIRARALK